MKRFLPSPALLAILFLIVATIGVGAYLYYYRPWEPSYQGLPLSHWIARFRQDDNREAGRALVAIGAPAVPALAAALKDERPTVRQAAAAVLAQLGPAAEPAIPRLAKALRDEEKTVRDAAALALEKIGPAAIPALTKKLRDKIIAAREAAARVLERMGPAGVPPLAEAIADDDFLVHHLALGTLEKLGPVARDAIPALARALRDKGMTDAVANVLRKIGPAAVPTFVDALRDRDKELRWLAAWSLGELGPAAKDAVPVLAEMLKDEDFATRELAASTLAKIGSSAKDAIPALVATLLSEEDDVVWDTAARAVKKISPGGKDAIPALRKALRDKDVRVRNVAAKALKTITN